MILIDFIKEHENWRDILSKEPYCLSIKEKDNYALLKYNQIESDMSLPIVQVCRGIIIDLNNLTIACRRFDKFFNAFEEHAAKLEGKIMAEEKIDGSIIGVWNDRDGNWRVSTNGMIDASDANILMPFNNIQTYGDLFNLALNNAGVSLNSFNNYKDYTLIFELVSPLNRIVVPYKETELYFLGLRNNLTGEEVAPYDTDIKYFKVPKLYDIDTVEQAIKIAKTLGADEEGFVLVDKNFNRVKVKGTEYLSMHLLRNNDLSLKNFLMVVLNHSQDDLLAYFPEYEDYIRDIEKRLKSYENDVLEAISSAPWNLDRKSFALQVKNSKYAKILFKLYDNKDYDWRAKEFSVDNINKLTQVLELR